MKTPFILALNDPQATDASLTGGKGSRLALLKSQGFAVPDAFIVTSAGYSLFVQEIPQNEISHLIENHPLPILLREAILNHLASFDSDGLAIRSSSTMEDLADSAFAGQHETFLNVRGAENILESIRQCFISLWNERAISYREQRGYHHHQAAMAVVVQRLVPCESAGVAFSLNPVTGNTCTIVVEANHGLGESVVSGETDTDHWELDRSTLKIRKETISHKTEKTISTDNGVMLQRLSAEEGRKACLSPEKLEDIGRLILAVEAAARFPQDIEWGYADGQLWLLQARAVTTIPANWTREESAERFPNPITSLTWDFIEKGFHRSLNYSLGLMGMPPCKERWFGSFDHYIYGNQNLVEIYCHRSPFTITSHKDLESLIPVLRKEFHWVQQLPINWARDLDTYLIGIGKAQAVDSSTLGDAELWSHIKNMAEQGSDYFLPNIAISITHGSLCRLLHHLISLTLPAAEAPAVFQALLAWGNTKTSQINRELHGLAEIIRDDADLTNHLINYSSREFAESDLMTSFPEFGKRFHKFLEDHGHRETDIDMYQPPWGDAPWIVVDHLRALLRAGISRDPIHVEREAKLAAYHAEEKLLSRVPGEFRFFYSEIIRLARLYTQLDDMEHYQTTRLNLPMRRALHVLGQRFTAQGILAEPMDIFHATESQIDQLLSDGISKNLLTAIAKQKQTYQDACVRTPGWQPHEEDTVNISRKDSLHGKAGSPGVAEGTVYQVKGPEDFANFPKGAILVSRTTNPAWTPLFHLAAAVITESGGPLSHGAVTARELGIPAVMGIPNCMNTLTEGTRVQVDGLRGIVAILPDAA